MGVLLKRGIDQSLTEEVAGKSAGVGREDVARSSGG